MNLCCYLAFAKVSIPWNQRFFYFVQRWPMDSKYQKWSGLIGSLLDIKNSLYKDQILMDIVDTCMRNWH